MVAIVSDIHINLRRHSAFETSRVLALAALLVSKDYTHIVLNGDLLDHARPTLQEAKLAQDFIKIISNINTMVYLLDGNHEAIDVSKKLSTYDYIQMPSCVYIKDSVVQIEERDIRMVSWSHLKALSRPTAADLLITHVRCEVKPHIKAERDMMFLQEYPLCILGDIHSRYAPADNALYTSSPYAISFSSKDPKGSYIEINMEDMIPHYVDTNLAQKVKLVGVVEDFRDFTPDNKDIYNIVVSGTLEDLRTLKAHKNVLYTKIIDRIEVEEEIPETTDLHELLVDRVCHINQYESIKRGVTSTIIKELIDG